MQSLTLQELMFSAQIPSHTPHFLPKLSFVSVEALGHFQFPHNSLSGFPCAPEDSVCLLFCPGPPFWSLSPSRTFNPSPKQSQDQHEPPAMAPAQAWPGLRGRGGAGSGSAHARSSSAGSEELHFPAGRGRGPCRTGDRFRWPCP